ncbi:transcriptional regulator, GntR family [Phenylobacterium zucineum HLK1]|uniref:Transcriptional regulator, GntR family n=1 Tax=Phenylobacterium zucineum (strain HLK1) TaxID=450851 RepID=B4REL5_PHEZH|nr:GntR family transcriptional regulator [Phenylobacterium zucineum]ACG78541.1 transcriptional regulator, GntR family [Phenylobacterium zucineum HLK1]
MADAVERAYRTIRDGIMNGLYPQGAHITAQDLAAASGLSRTPVREAMRRLQSEGLIVIYPNRGAFVASWNERDIHKIYDLRVLLEGYAAEAAALEADEAAVAELTRLAREMADAVERQDADVVDQVAQINSDFHRLVIAAAANPRLDVALASIVEVPLVLRTFRRYSLEEMRRSAAQHLELVAAIAARDGVWARSVMTSHILSGRNALLRSFATEAASQAQAAPDRAAG